MALLSSSCPPGEQLTWHLHTLAICVDVCPLITSTFVGVNFPLSILGINGWRTEGLCLSIGQMLWDCETVGGRQFRAANLMTLQPIDTTSRQCFWARVQIPSAHALPHPDTNLNTCIVIREATIRYFSAWSGDCYDTSCALPLLGFICLLLRSFIYVWIRCEPSNKITKASR